MDLIAIELKTMVRELLSDRRQTSLYSTQSGLRSVVYNAVEHVMLHLLWKEVIDETLTAHIASFFNSYVADDKLSKSC